MSEDSRDKFMRRGKYKDVPITVVHDNGPEVVAFIKVGAMVHIVVTRRLKDLLKAFSRKYRQPVLLGVERGDADMALALRRAMRLPQFGPVQMTPDLVEYCRTLELRV